jgi:hypothetical protein
VELGSTTRKRQLNNTENVFLPRGQNSQDTPEIAQRRREIVAIQREHRFLNRRGEAHLQTPPLYTPDEAPPDEAPIPSPTAIPTRVSIPPTRAAVGKYNAIRLRDLLRPVVVISQQTLV